MNLPVKKVENHTYNLKYGTADSTSRRNSGDAYVLQPWQVWRKRLRSYVLKCFHRLRTFAFQNPNVSKNGDKRNGHISSSRKTI